MKNTLQHRGWISRIRLLAASVALALPVVLVPTLIATQSAQAQSYKVLYRFTGGADGAAPYAGLVRDPAGNLYSTTAYGGASNVGTVFKLDTTGTETVLHSFSGMPDGAQPEAGLVLDKAGNLYGTTAAGGINCTDLNYQCGVIFKVDPTGNETVLYRFTGGADGARPEAGLVLDKAGNLYGTAESGGFTGGECGSWGCGVVFKLDPTGKEAVLYSFTDGADGASPAADLIRDEAGNLYGTNLFGPPLGKASGTVFKLDPTGKETVLYSFTGGPDGGWPHAGLVRDKSGNLYGTTYYGGTYGFGTVFKVDTSGNETVLYSFAGSPKGDGARPLGKVSSRQGGQPLRNHQQGRWRHRRNGVQAGYDR